MRIACMHSRNRMTSKLFPLVFLPEEGKMNEPGSAKRPKQINTYMWIYNGFIERNGGWFLAISGDLGCRLAGVKIDTTRGVCRPCRKVVFFPYFRTREQSDINHKNRVVIDSDIFEWESTSCGYRF